MNLNIIWEGLLLGEGNNNYFVTIDKIRENGFELTMKRSWRNPAKTITDADYTNDIAILANTPNQAETLQRSLEWDTTGIGLHVNAHETEYVCFNQTGDISTLDGTSLKLVDKFTYLGSSVSSTEKDINTRLTKAWTAIDKLWSYGNQTWPIKWNAVSSRQRRVDTAIWMHYLDASKTDGEEARWQLHKNVASNTEQVLAATPHKAPTIRPPAFHHENYPSLTNQTCRTLLEKQGRAHKWCTPMDPHIWPSKTRRPARTYIQQLCKDTGCSPEDLPEAMNDKEKWRREGQEYLC